MTTTTTTNIEKLLTDLHESVEMLQDDDYVAIPGEIEEAIVVIRSLVLHRDALLVEVENLVEENNKLRDLYDEKVERIRELEADQYEIEARDAVIKRLHEGWKLMLSNIDGTGWKHHWALTKSQRFPELLTYERATDFEVEAFTRATGSHTPCYGE